MMFNGEGTYFVFNKEDEAVIRVIGIIDGELRVINAPILPYFFVNKPDEAVKHLDKLKDLGVVSITNEGLKTGDEIKEPVATVRVNAPNIVPNIRDYFRMKGFRTFEDNIVYIRRLFIDNKLKVKYDNYVFFDIETDSSFGFPKEYGKYPFLSISVYDSKKRWSKWFYVKDYESERDMLVDFIKFMQQKKAGLVVGWNVDFDYGHVKERLRELNLYDEYRYWKVVARLDLLSQYKARKPGLGSYSLHNVSIEEGFKIKEMKKLPHEMTRNELYEYNMYDSEILVDINNRYDLVETAIEIANSMNLPMSAAQSTVARLEAEMFRRLRELGYVGVKREGRKVDYSGAIVLEGIPGLHENVVVFDYESLYPNTIINKNIDIKGFNGEVFPYVVKKALDARLKHKRRWKELKKKYEELKELYEKTGDEKIKKELEKVEHDMVVEKLKSDALKIVVNGFYGANANQYYYFFDPDVAAAITAGGREMLMKAKNYIESSYKLKVIYGDSVAKDSWVVIKDGKKIYSVTIDELFNMFKHNGVFQTLDGKEYVIPDREILTPSLDTKNAIIEWKPVKYIMRHLVDKKMYRVFISKESYIDVTEDHSLITMRTKYNGNKKVRIFEETKPVDAVKKSIPMIGFDANYQYERDVSSMVWELIGYMVGDGYWYRGVYDGGKKRYYSYLSAGKDYNELVSNLLLPLSGFGINLKYYKKGDKGDITLMGTWLNATLKHFKDNNNNRIVPEFMHKLPIKFKIAFIRGLFSADGTVIRSRGRVNSVRLANVNKQFLINVGRILSELGIPWILTSNKRNNMYKNYEGRLEYYLDVKDINKFKKVIGFVLERKNSVLSMYEIGKSSYRKYLPFALAHVKKVEEIEYDDYVYDIEVEDNHNFFANGLLVHNTDSIFVEFGNSFGELDKEKIMEIASFISNDLNEYVKPWKMDVDKVIKKIIFLADKKGNFVKKRYAYIDFNGNIKVKGLEMVKGDWPKITKWLQGRVIEMILKDGASRSEVMRFVNQVKKEMYEGKYDEWLILSKSLSKDVSEYAAGRKLPEHVQAWVKAEEMGTPFELKQVTYVFTRDQGVMPVLKPSDVKKYKIDYDYYWKHRIEEPVMKVINSVYPPNRSILEWLS